MNEHSKKECRKIKLDNGIIAEVDSSTYKEHWKLKNRENYLRKVDGSNVDVYTDINSVNSSEDIEKLAERNHLIALLNDSLETLSEEERSIINDIFFSDKKKLPQRSRKKIRNISSGFKQKSK